MTGHNEDNVDSDIKHPRAGILRPLFVASLSVTLFSFLVFFDRLLWIGDLACQFLPQYLALQTLALTAAIITKDRHWCILCVLCIALDCCRLASFPPAAPFRNAKGKEPVRTLKIVSLNLWTSNPRPGATLSFLRNSRADMLALLEVNHKWNQRLKTLDDIYPYKVVAARSDNFGMALYSKIEIVSHNIRFLSGKRCPSIIARLSTGSRNFEVVVFHPTPPKHPWYWRERNRIFSAFTGIRPRLDADLLVVGDFNAPPWSRHFRNLVHDCRLYLCRGENSLLFSWPSFIPVLWSPIDHCLVSSCFSVVDCNTGPFLWSDHFPLIIDLLVIDKAATS